MDPKRGKKIEIATEETMNTLRNKIHELFREQLNSGTYQNGAPISTIGAVVKADLWINNGKNNLFLRTEDLSHKDTRYILKFNLIGSNINPIRIGVDNCHDYAHIDIGDVKFEVPVYDSMNIGMCGSVVTGLTLTPEDLQKLKPKIKKYYEMFI